MVVERDGSHVYAVAGFMFLMLHASTAINATLDLDLSLNVEFNGLQTTCNCKMRETMCSTRIETCERCPSQVPNTTMIFKELISEMKPTPPKTPETNTTKQKITDFRIPTDLYPINYFVQLFPNITAPDPANFSFESHVTIRMKCKKETDKLYLHSKGLTVEAIQFDGGPNIVSYEEDNDREFLMVHLDSNTTAGRYYNISLISQSPLKKVPKGLYYSNYTRNGKPVYLVATYLKPNYARRIFPCFDEPSIKSIFEIHLQRPTSYVSLSNVPLTESAIARSKDRYSVDIFKIEEIMPTYLLAFIICDFKYTEKITQNGVHFRVWTRPELIKNATYALEHGFEVIPFYEKIFNGTIPLRKLDMVAVPEYRGDGVEGLGLTIVGEDDMLTMNNKPCGRVSPVVNKLIASQWFAAKLTHRWWDDQWLRDGLINVIHMLGVDHFYPDWITLERFMSEMYNDVMYSDSFMSANPIHRLVPDPSKLNEVLNTFTTTKATVVIRMMRQFLGFETFKAGLCHYKLAKGADVDTLWSILTKQVKKKFESIDVKEVMDTWTLQINYPLVTVTRDDSYNGALSVQQERYLQDPNDTVSGQSVSPFNYTWNIPLTFASNHTRNFNESNLPIYWLWRNETSKLINASDWLPSRNTWFICNVYMNGYYRVNYDRSNWLAIAKQLKENHEVIPLMNRIQIVNDALTLARRDLLPYDTVFSILDYLKNEREYLVWVQFFAKFSHFVDMLSLSPAYGSFQKFMHRITKDFYQHLMNHTSNETTWKDQNDNIYINTLACFFELPECVQDKAADFKTWMDDPSNFTLAENMEFSTYCSGILKGGAVEWNFLLEMYKIKQFHTSYIISTLACTRVPWLLNKLLDMAIDKDSPIPKEHRPSIFGYIDRYIGRSLSWNFFRTHFNKLKELYENSTSLSTIIYHVTNSFNTDWELMELKAFKLDHEGNFGSGEAAMLNAIKKVESNLQWMNKHYNTIAAWLKANVN